MHKKLKTSLCLAVLLPGLVISAPAAPAHPMLKFSIILGGRTIAVAPTLMLP